MENIVTRLMRNSIKLRNVSALSNYNTLHNYVNSSQDTLACRTSENDGENINKLNSLNLDNDPKHIIKRMQQNCKSMDVKEAIKLMDSLQKLFIKNNKLPYVNLKDSEEFVYMCKIIHKNVRSLHMYDIIHILRTLLFFNVPPNSMLIQTLLQLIRVSLNNLSVAQIITIYNTLNKLETLPLIKSLLIALPYVFEQQVQFELNTESNNLLQALKFSCTINNLNVKMHIINILLKSEQNIKSENIVDIFYALCTLPQLNSCSMKLLFKIKSKIRTNCQYLTFNEIQLLLYYISVKVANEEMQFYCEEMIDALCNAALNHTVTFSQNITILKYLNTMRHSNTSLLDHLIAKCLNNKNILKGCSISDVDNFIKGFIIADYKPPSWETVQTILLDAVTNIDYSVHNAASVALRLLSLDCYCPQLLEKAFTLYQSKSVKITNERTILTMLKLHWYVKMLYPRYNGITLNKTTLNQIHIVHKENKVPSLLESLKEVFKGTDCIKTDLRSKFGEFIDYVVVIKPNGAPMDVKNYNANIKFVEELESLSECNKLLFLVFPEKAYSFNKRNMLSTLHLQVKALETLKGFYTFVINPFLWKNLSDNEKVSYLQRVTDSKCHISDIVK